MFQTEGITEKEGIGPEFRSSEAKGGLKVRFLDKDNNSLGYMWMRPSGTEPVLRVLADLRGDVQDIHDKVLSYQRSLIERAN